MRWLFKNKKIVTIVIDGIEKQTKKATLIKYSGYNIWLPSKKISIKDKGGKFFVTLPEWLHREKFFFIGRTLIEKKSNWECQNCKHIIPHYQSICYNCNTLRKK